jgi:hypothetical protein
MTMKIIAENISCLPISIYNPDPCGKLFLALNFHNIKVEIFISKALGTDMPFLYLAELTP